MRHMLCSVVGAAQGLQPGPLLCSRVRPVLPSLVSEHQECPETPSQVDAVAAQADHCGFFAASD